MKHSTTTPEPTVRLDCVAKKKRIQAKIYEETKHMTWEEEREYYRKASEEFWAGVEHLRAKRAAEAQS